MAEVTQITPKHRKKPPQKPPETVPDAPPAVSTPEPEPPPAAASPKDRSKFKRGRPADNSAPRTDPAFFVRVKKVPKEDWGTRAWIYVYVTEPHCEPNTFGKYSYLVKLSSPIFDEDPLMMDYGSFKGYMTLNIRKPGASSSDLIDTYSFTIFNPKYPCKLPRSAWVNDPRNKKWAEMLPPPTTEKPAPDQNEMFKTFLDMRRDVREELEANREIPEPTPDPADQFKTVVTTAKELLTMAQPKGDDGGIMRDELRALRAELAAERAENRLLMREMLSAKSNPAQPVGATDPLDMFDKMMDRVDKIKERVAPEANGAGDPNRPSRMNGTQELIVEITKGIFNSPVAANLTQLLLMATAQKMNGGPAPNGQPPAAPQPGQPQLPPPQSQPMQPQGNQTPMKLTAQQFAQHIIPQFIEPLMLHLTDKDKDGYDLAEHVINGKGEAAYQFAKDHGPDLIMEAFALTPFWQSRQPGIPGLSAMEPQLRELVTEFCSWPPPDEDQPEGEGPTPTAADEPIDLMGDGAEG